MAAQRKLVGVLLDASRRQRQAAAEAEEVGLEKPGPEAGVEQQAEVGDALQRLVAVVEVALGVVERGAVLELVAGLDALDVVGELRFEVEVGAQRGLDREEDAGPLQVDDVLVGNGIDVRVAAVEAGRLDAEARAEGVDRTGRRVPRERGIASGRSALQQQGEEEHGGGTVERPRLFRYTFACGSSG